MLNLGFSESITITKTKSKLKELDSKITKVQEVLNSAQNKQNILNQELVNTEKKISASTVELQTLQRNVDTKQQAIVELQNKVNQLGNQLSTQQMHLAKHVRSQYMMGEYQPLKWLLNQDNPYNINRLLTLHQYLIESRKKTIAKMKPLKEALSASQHSLHAELLAQQQLQQQVLQSQERLLQDKHHHRTLIQSLNQDIVSNQQHLVEYRRNKDNLSHLLQSLVQQSVIRPQYSFRQMRHRLPKPIHGDKRNMQNLNQGLIFYAPEGTQVSAVFGGKVVFSDWLKGYGFILILDHGQGYMSLYANNKSLFKRKGEFVQQGELIALVGHSGALPQNGLYFEIRQRGRTSAPLGWLA